MHVRFPAEFTNNNMAEVPLLVTAEWLKGALAAGDQNLVVLDTSWVPGVKIEGLPFPDTTPKAMFERYSK